MARRIVNGQSGFAAITITGNGITFTIDESCGPVRRGRVVRVIVRVGAKTGAGSLGTLRLMLVSDQHTDATTVATVPDEAKVWDSGDIPVVHSTTEKSYDVVLEKPACFAGGLRLVGSVALTGAVTAALLVAIDLLDEV